jgi:multidrug efflux pump subunit AcrA (membrane-fusion protein)
MAKRGRNRRARIVTAAGITAVVLVAGGAVTAYATSRGTAPTYVTATAGPHSVLQSLQATGTTEPSSAATVSFAVSGSVATVPVTMGQKVSAGQLLATLDNTALQYALATAQGQVANAKLTLTQAESGQVSAASGAGGTGTPSATGTGGATSSATKTGTTGSASTAGATGSPTNTAATGSTSTSGTATSKTGGTGTIGTAGSKTGTTGSTTTTKSSNSTAPITAAQKALLVAVRQTDTLLTKSKADLALATAPCATSTHTSATPTTPATPATPTTPSPTSTTPAPTSTTSTPTPTGGKPTVSPAALTTPVTTAQKAGLTTTGTGPSVSCAQAQQLVLNDQSQLLTLEQGLSGQETALDTLITSAVASTGTASTGKATPTGTPTVGTSSAGTGSTAGKTTANGTSSAGTAAAPKTTAATGTTTVAVSAAQLAADQAAVDAANADLVLAQQQLSQASIVSPFTGVVSSVGLTVGQQATAGSTTDAIDVIDPTGHGVILSVDVTKIPQVKLGEKATVVPDGSSIPLAATVSDVAAAPTTSSSTAYNVQLAFTSNPTKLRDGVQAAVTITTAKAVNALAVPTSAINHLGSLSYVLVPNGSATKIQIITVGSVGALYSQVTGGLTAGQRVVLANPNTPIPTSTATGRIAQITGGASSTTGLLGGTSGTSGTRPSG